METTDEGKNEGKNPLMTMVVIIATLIIQIALVWAIWNALLPSLFGVRGISFFEGLLLLLLTRILVGR